MTANIPFVSRAEQEFLTAESGIIVLAGKGKKLGNFQIFETDLPGFQAWMLIDPKTPSTQNLLSEIRAIGPGQLTEISLRPGHRGTLFPIDYVLGSEKQVAGFLVPERPNGQVLHSAIEQNALTDLDRLSVGTQLLGMVGTLRRSGLMVPSFESSGLILHREHLLSFTDWPSLRQSDPSPDLTRHKSWETSWVEAVNHILTPFAITVDRAVEDMQNLLWHQLAGADFAAPLQARLYALETALAFAWKDAAMTIWRETPQLYRLPIASGLVVTMRRLTRANKAASSYTTKTQSLKPASRRPVGPMLMDPLPITFRKVAIQQDTASTEPETSDDVLNAEPASGIRYSIDQSGPTEDPIRLTIFLPHGIAPSDLAVLNRATGEVLAEIPVRPGGENLEFELQRPDGPTVIALAHATASENSVEKRLPIFHPPLRRRMLGQPVTVTKTKRRLQRRIVSPGFRRS